MLNSGKKLKVLVGISGGVDSAVSAALLKESGFDVTGGFMKCWDEMNGCCTTLADEAIARKVAAHLDIPLYVFDFVSDYRKRVFQYFLKEYKAGRTPNPDTMCNREIKFGLFYEKALELGFDRVATGHYCRIERGKVLRAVDKNKDQSYFLYGVPRQRFQNIIFPVGNYLKSQIRKLALDFGLPNAKRPDSQGICFVGEVKLSEFLGKYIKGKKGNILNKEGKVLGHHQGLYYYTIGQRHGLNITGGPYYVVGKHLKKNLLFVSKEGKDLLKNSLVAREINWISQVSIKKGMKLQAKIRYRQEPEEAVIKRYRKGAMELGFKNSQRAIASGQAVVFYRKQEMLGGGTISS